MSNAEYWTDTLKDLTERIANLLAEDAAQFVTRAVREAFVAATDTEADPAHCKAVAARHAQAAATAAAAQAHAIRWREAPPPADGTPEGASALTPVQASVDAAAAAALEEAGLPGPADAYRLPRRFIGGDTLVSLLRAARKATDGLALVEQHARQTTTTQHRADRRQAWDDA